MSEKYKMLIFNFDNLQLLKNFNLYVIICLKSFV